MTPLNDKLKNVEWGEFRIGELFEKLNLKFHKSTFDKENDISRKKTKEFDLPLVNAKDGDNGIMYYGRSKDFDSADMTIDIVNDGAVSTASVYTQPQKTGVLYNAYLVKPKFKASEEILHFFTTAIFKSIKPKFGYDNKAGWSKVKQEPIQLPTKNGTIDFDFMERFVAELENERILKLENYLNEIGLSDYHLTEKETQALENYAKLDWSTFNLENLFGKSTRGRRLKSADRVAGTLPFITAGEMDEGVSAFIGNGVTVFSANTATIDMFGSAKYRNFEYGGDDHIAVVHTDKLPKYASVFVTSAIHKSSYNGQFNYGRNFYAKDADALDISLPVKDGTPDYETMETVISAIHKMVIKDVVLYVERKKRELNKLTENAQA
jgi:hypothetical protein